MNVQVNVTHDAVTDNVLTGVQIGVPWMIHDRNQGAIRAARAELQAARRTVEAIELNLKERLASIYQTHAQARSEVLNYQQEILPRSQRSYELVTRAYEAGEVGYLELLTAQKTFFEANQLAIQSLRNAWDSYLVIEGQLVTPTAF